MCRRYLKDEKDCTVDCGIVIQFLSERALFTREYFREELLRFRELMGSKDFWSDVKKSLPTNTKCSRALYGLLYVFVNTPDLREDDKILLEATTMEFDRRLAYMLMR